MNALQDLITNRDYIDYYIDLVRKENSGKKAKKQVKEPSFFEKLCPCFNPTIELNRPKLINTRDQLLAIAKMRYGDGDRKDQSEFSKYEMSKTGSTYPEFRMLL